MRSFYVGNTVCVLKIDSKFSLTEEFGVTNGCCGNEVLPRVKYPGPVTARPVSESGLPILMLHSVSISLTIAGPGDLTECMAACPLVLMAVHSEQHLQKLNALAMC